MPSDLVRDRIGFLAQSGARQVRQDEPSGCSWKIRPATADHAKADGITDKLSVDLQTVSNKTGRPICAF